MCADNYFTKTAMVSIFYTAAIFGQSAHAQIGDPIKACQATSANQGEEITCLRNVVRGLLDTPALSAEIAPAPPEAAAPAPVEPPAITAGASPQPEEEETPIGAVAATTGIGAEQVIAKQEKQARKTKAGREKQTKKHQESTYVVDFAYTSRGQLILVLANGQVWAQRKGDAQDVRLTKNEKTPVTIRRGALSGYRINFTDKRRVIVAERLK